MANINTKGVDFMSISGQILLRKTNKISKSGKEVFIVLGLIGLDKEDIKLDNLKDGYKYNVIDFIMNNGKDFSELNNNMSPEELLEEKIWVVK
jgi:hypothetical protein